MTELDERFSVLAQTSSRLLQLVPSILCSIENVEFSSVTQLYAQDAPSPEILEKELSRWKHMHMSKATSERAEEEQLFSLVAKSKTKFRPSLKLDGTL